MLNVHIRKDGFSMKGHADFAKRGQDIVCSACSANALFAIDMLEVYSEIDAKIEEGDVVATILEPSKQTEEVLETLYFFMRKMRATYPKHINVTGGVK